MLLMLHELFNYKFFKILDFNQLQIIKCLIIHPVFPRISVELLLHIIVLIENLNELPFVQGLILNMNLNLF
jgi:hypothetical protein